MTYAIFSVFLTPFSPLSVPNLSNLPFYGQFSSNPLSAGVICTFIVPTVGQSLGLSVCPSMSRPSIHVRISTRPYVDGSGKLEKNEECLVFFTESQVQLWQRKYEEIRNRFPDPDSLEDDHNKRIRIQKYPENGDYGPKHIGAENSRFSGLVVSHVIESRHGLDT